MLVVHFGAERAAADDNVIALFHRCFADVTQEDVGACHEAVRQQIYLLILRQIGLVAVHGHCRKLLCSYLAAGCFFGFPWDKPL